MTEEKRIRCGDHVFHRPSGEKWVVAYADYESGKLAWMGWPNGTADLADCELVQSADDEKHRRDVKCYAEKTEDDGRRSNVLRLYGHVLQALPDKAHDGAET